MKSSIKKYKFIFIGSILGLSVGFVYWYFIGCSSGTCAITSSPLNSSVYGAFVGGIFGSTFKETNKKEVQDK